MYWAICIFLCKGLCIGIFLMYVLSYVNYVCLCISPVYFYITKCVHSYEPINKSRLAQAAFMLFSLLRYYFRIFLPNHLKYSVSFFSLIPSFWILFTETVLRRTACTLDQSIAGALPAQFDRNTWRLKAFILILFEVQIHDLQKTVQAVDRAVAVQAFVKTKVEFQLNKYVV